MKTMNRKGNAVLIAVFVLLAIALAFGGYFALKGAGLFDVAAVPYATHTHTAFGHTITAASYWQNFLPHKSPGGSTINRCDKQMLDSSIDNDSISISGSTFNGGSSCNFDPIQTTVSFTDLDLSKYKKVTIHRSGTLTGAGSAGGNAGYQASINNNPLLTTRQTVALNGGTVTGGLGDIYVINNGLTIMVQATPESPDGALFPADKPLFLTNTVKAFGGQHSGTNVGLSYKITGIDATPLINAPADQANLPSWLSVVLAQIRDFLTDTFGKLFTFSVAGPQSVTPGQSLTYQLSIPEPYPLKTDYTQGVYMQRWCSAALIDKNQAVAHELPFETCSGTWTKTYTLTMPNGTYADYAVIGVMVETRQDFANGAWTKTYENKVVSKESLSLTSKVLITPGASATPSGWSVFWNTITSWFRGLWA